MSALLVFDEKHEWLSPVFENEYFLRSERYGAYLPSSPLSRCPLRSSTLTGYTCMGKVAASIYLHWSLVGTGTATLVGCPGGGGGYFC